MYLRKAFHSFLCNHPRCVLRAYRVLRHGSLWGKRIDGRAEHRSDRLEVCGHHVRWALDIVNLLAKVKV